jgi:hypothetical protein
MQPSHSRVMAITMASSSLIAPLNSPSAIAALDISPKPFSTPGMRPRRSIAGWRSSSRISSMLSITTSVDERSH